MKLKTDAVNCLRKFQAHYLRIGTVQYWRTDGERTLTTAEMGAWLEERFAHHEKTVPGNSYQNGRAEAAIRVVMTIARCLRAQARFCKPMWLPCVRTATYLRRLHVSRRNERDVTLHELFFGERPSVLHLRKFGCRLYVRLNVQGDKMEPRARPAIMCGYDDDIVGGLHAFFPEVRKVFRTMDYIADETLIPGVTSKQLGTLSKAEMKGMDELQEAARQSDIAARDALLRDAGRAARCELERAARQADHHGHPGPQE